MTSCAWKSDKAVLSASPQTLSLSLHCGRCTEAGFGYSIRHCSAVVPLRASLVEDGSLRHREGKRLPGGHTALSGKPGLELCSPKAPGGILPGPHLLFILSPPSHFSLFCPLHPHQEGLRDLRSGSWSRAPHPAQPSSLGAPARGIPSIPAGSPLELKGCSRSP